MALITTAGTETLHTAHFADVGGSQKTLIAGVQHHTYTVLSIIVFLTAWGDEASSHGLHIRITGYDSAGSSSGHSIQLVKARGMELYDTYVFNDKFSFNGYEPSSNSHDARAAQASGTAQSLTALSSSGGNTHDITITYIDQNNS